MRTKTSHVPPAAGHYRLACGTRLHDDYVVCEHPLRIVRPGTIVLRLLAACSEERTPGELATLLRLPHEQVERLCEQLRWKGLLEAGSTPPESWPGVSVIIPSYNRAEQLERCLRSILHLRYPAHSLEVIVVDDGSTDSTGSMVERISPDFAARGIVLRHVRHTHRRGAAQSRNDGATQASFALLAYLDSDCIATADWLVALVPAFSDPTIAAAGAMVRARERRTLLGRYEDKKSSLYMATQAQRVTLEGPLTYLPTANLLVRREAVHKAGGFAPMPFGEDVDLCRRLLSDGARILYLPQGIVLHDYRTTLPAFLRVRISYASSEAALLQRHPGARRVLLLPPEQAAFAGTAIGALWGLLWIVARYLSKRFKIRRGEGSADVWGVPLWSPASQSPGCDETGDEGHPLWSLTSCLHSCSETRDEGHPQEAPSPPSPPLSLQRITTIAFVAALFLTLLSTVRRLRNVRRQRITLHPFVVLRATLRGHLAYTYHLCRHLTRYYTLPLLIAGIIVPPALLLLLILSGIVVGVDYARLRPNMHLGQFVVCSLLDDCAYEVGVVRGCIKQRTWKPLVPLIRKKL